MSKKVILGVLTLLIFSLLLPLVPALATSPTLTLSSTGDGDSVQINVSGPASSSVIMSYLRNGSSQVSFLGNTNSSGLFSTTISTAAYNISPNSLVHVTIGGINGAQSSDVAWPYISAGNLALDKTSIVLPIGQSTTINAYNNGSNLIYLASNSNPIVANANLSGNQISITANNFGATVINICSQANSTSCASAYINVQNTGATSLVFSQNTVGLPSGQATSINIYGGTGSYILTNNSNSNNVLASLSGSSVSLTPQTSSGFSAITICSSDLSACGIINAHIGASTTATLSLSQTSPTLSVGQNISLSISGGGSSSYSILSNSNSTAVSASIANGALSLTGLSGGSATIIVCSSLGYCKSVTPTVISTGGNTGGAITLSQNNLWLLINQTLSLTISGGTTPYSLVSGNSNIATSTINNNILTVTGINAGSASINVCSALGGCTALAVLVGGTNPNATSNISLSPSQVSINSLSTSATVNIIGNGSYFIASASNPNVASAMISGSQVIVSPISSGTNTVSICQNGGQCSNLLITVNITPFVPVTTTETNTTLSIPNNSLVRTPNGKIYFVSNNTKEYVSSLAELKTKYAKQKIQDVSSEVLANIPSKVMTYKFVGNLSYGSSGTAVSELQKRLKALGLYLGEINGRYNTALVVAVRNYQKNNGIRQTGNVGPATAASLNK